MQRRLCWPWRCTFYCLCVAVCFCVGSAFGAVVDGVVVFVVVVRCPVRHCSHQSGGKAKLSLVGLGAPSPVGTAPEQMAGCFAHRASQSRARARLTPLSSGKTGVGGGGGGGKGAGSLGDPFSACSLFNYMWIPGDWGRATEPFRRSLAFTRRHPSR